MALFRLALLLVLTLSLTFPAYAQETAPATSPIYGGIQIGLARYSVPEQSFGGFTLSADPITGFALTGTLGVEAVPGVSGVLLPVVTILTNDGESVTLGGATLAARFQLRQSGTLVAPYIDGGYTFMGALNSEAENLSSRGITIGGGIAVLPSGRRGFTLDVRFYPLATGPDDFRLDENLLIFSVGVVGFGQ
ncbi:MAG: hypothetical protein AAGN64_09690 [Bacteroidota bacterium]